MTSVSFDITIINDTVLENDEMFQLIIVSHSLPNTVRRGEIKQVTVTILNNGGSGQSIS